MPPQVREADNDPGTEFTKQQRAFLCEKKMCGKKYPEIKRLFVERFGRQAPTRDGVHKMLTKFRTSHTVSNLKGRGPKVTARTPRNIARVQRECERAEDREPGEPGPSARRHAAPVSKSTFNRITKHDLKKRPYRIQRLHQVMDVQTAARVRMGRFLASKPLDWFRDLVVSDEAWFTLSGHVFNAKNTVCYGNDGEGRPAQWVSQAVQSPDKVMVFCLLKGSGEKFGPYFIPPDEPVNQFSYRELLEKTVFPLMMLMLGRAVWGRTWWQQDGAKPHQARMVMQWLDGIFGERLLALKSLRGVDWAPSSPDMNPVDYYLWPRMKSLTYAPPPPTMTRLRRKITVVFGGIPAEEVSRAVLSMKKRGRMLVQAGGKQFEGAREE